jgi:hypothetical protein
METLNMKTKLDALEWDELDILKGAIDALYAAKK